MSCQRWVVVWWGKSSTTLGFAPGPYSPLALVSSRARLPAEKGRPGEPAPRGYFVSFSVVTGRGAGSRSDCAPRAYFPRFSARFGPGGTPADHLAESPGSVGSFGPRGPNVCVPDLGEWCVPRRCRQLHLAGPVGFDRASRVGMCRQRCLHIGVAVAGSAACYLRLLRLDGEASRELSLCGIRPTGREPAGRLPRTAP
jgi:hypothetical protein